MKKILLFISIFISFQLFAQTNVYHPLPDSNAHWTVRTWEKQFGGGSCIINDDYTLFISRDTVIGVNTYHIILRSGHRYSNCPPPGWHYFNQVAGLIRQDIAQKKVFELLGNNVETLLYDFNLKVGDTLSSPYNGGNNNYVVGIDSTLVGSNYHKRFLLNHLYKGTGGLPDTSYALIEGVGSTLGLFNRLEPPFEAGSELKCFWNNGQSFPKNYNCPFATGVNETNEAKVQFEVFPNPSMGIFSIESDEKFQFSVYDVFGREVLQSTDQTQSKNLDLSSYPKGIYFVRGEAKDKMFFRKIILQ